MCGVNGVFAYRDAAPAPSETELLAVRDAMAARGPDGVGDCGGAQTADAASAIGAWRSSIPPTGPPSR